SAKQLVENSETVSQKALKILVAEDDTVKQKVTLRQLKKLGYKADIAANGLEVLSAFDQNAYDVVLMDCHMPEMDGFEATGALRHKNLAKQPHIIALTANAMQGDREKCLAAGMDEYVSKPVQLAELQAALGQWHPSVGSETTV